MRGRGSPSPRVFSSTTLPLMPPISPRGTPQRWPLVAKNLVGELQKMGLPAVRANGQPPPQLNDIAIVGYFVSVDAGSIAKRFALGFGSGTPALATVVEVYV